MQAPDGSKNVAVGKVIALLAEDGDDLSNLQLPAEESAPAAKQPEPTPTPKPSSESQPKPASSHSDKHIKHSRPLFPSVLRLLQVHDVPDPEKIKGTGIRGMLTKGDVLAHLGLASNPMGTFKETKSVEQAPPAKKQEEVKVSQNYGEYDHHANYCLLRSHSMVRQLGDLSCRTCSDPLSEHERQQVRVHILQLFFP